MVCQGHVSLPTKYAPFGQHREVADRLKARTWRAREVLNFTVKAFCNRSDSELSIEQRRARDEFVAEYRKQVAGGFNERGIGKDPEDPTVDATLTQYKNWLDQYFFFGTMPDYALEVRAYTAEYAGKDALPCESWKSDRIYVPMSNASEPFDLHEIVALIVHEMTHLYLKKTVCPCEDCSKNDMQGIGMSNDRHGPIFQILNRLIVTEIRKWHDILRDFDDSDSPGKSVSLYSQKAHFKACSRADKSYSYPFDSGLTKKQHLHLKERGEDVVVVVRKKLLEDQKAVESRLRRRGAENAEDVVTDSDSESEKGHGQNVAEQEQSDSNHNGNGTAAASGNDETRTEQAQPNVTATA